MKGGITLAIYIAIGITGAAFGQSSTHVKTVKTVKTVTVTLAPVDQLGRPFVMTPAVVTPAVIKPLVEPPPAPEKVVMTFGNGGSIPEHKIRFNGYRLAGVKVELRGPCYSACTLITAYVAKQNLCIGEGAFMAFHAARMTMDGPIHGPATIAMVEAYPKEIQHWIERNGGVEKLPRDGYWTMYDRELWAMGYPKCQ